MKKYIIFSSNAGIEFERTDSGRKSWVRVRNQKQKTPLAIYRFPNRPEVIFNSPFISWENLNCCNGWTFDNIYLHTAVQQGKKLCAGIHLASLPYSIYGKKELNALIGGLGPDFLCYHTETSNSFGPVYSIDIVRVGKISDYIDLSAVKNFYDGVIDYPIDFKEVERLCNKEMISLVKNEEGWDYGNEYKTVADSVVAGLLLGYPLESTISFIHDHKFPNCLTK